MSEKNDWHHLRGKMRFPYDRWDRIENCVVVGMPDINYCIKGIEGWIEMKSPMEPVRMLTPLFGSNHKLSQDQMNWFKRQANAHGRAFVLIGTDRRWLLVHGRFADKINHLTVEDLVGVAEWVVPKPVNAVEAWANLREALIR